MGRSAVVESLFSVPPNFFDGARLYRCSSDAAAADSESEVAVAEELLGKLRLGDAAEDQEDVEAVRLSRWTCGACRMKFYNGEEQRVHFKSDFHRLNVKRKLVGKASFNEEQFETFAAGNMNEDSGVSSISGSDSDSEDDKPEARIQRQFGSKQIPILLSSGSIVQVWRSVLLSDKEELEEKDIVHKEPGANVTETELMSRLRLLTGLPTERKVWVVLLAIGGHFAGVVVDMKSGLVQAHQTYHRYVVRAKAGGKQANRDASGRAPKSAGASLRRYNELALQKEIRKLLESWGTFLREASCIFVFAPSRNSQSVFGEKPLLDRNDGRIRHIPFATKRPTYKEAKRVYGLLASLTYKEKESAPAVSAVENAEDLIPSPEIKSKEEDQQEEMISQKNLSTDQENVSTGADGTVSDETASLTPLHEASLSGNADLVLELLEQGADPCVREQRGRTAYALAADKNTRNAFRRFMGFHPDMWDWHAANVPSPLTDEMEAVQAAKQAEKNAKRKAKEKERKKEKKAQQKAEAKEKLSAASKVPDPQEGAHIARTRERELRAAAAESRMKASLLVPVNSDSSDACSCCGTSLANKVPFYKHSYKYCTVTCVNAHRRVLEGE